MMKGKITIISAICAILFGGIQANAQFRNGASFADLDDSETVRALKEHVSTISAAVMEGRKAGSEGERNDRWNMSPKSSAGTVSMCFPERRRHLRHQAGKSATRLPPAM